MKKYLEHEHEHETSPDQTENEIRRCGCCEQYHLRSYFGDCRSDQDRLSFEDVVRRFGEEALDAADAEFFNK